MPCHAAAALQCTAPLKVRQLHTGERKERKERRGERGKERGEKREGAQRIENF